MKFDGSSGRRPSAEARRYIYRCLASTLQNDAGDLSAGYLFDEEDLEEVDIRRLKKEAQKVIHELRVKAGLIPPRKHPLDWKRVELLMLKSFRGSYLAGSQVNYLQRAHREDPIEYGRRHRKMKTAEVKRIRESG